VTVICTIGFTKKNLPDFVERLRGAGVTKLLDIRLHNTSQLAGYAKKDDLAFVLELCQIDYEHIPELAPEEDILDEYRKSKDWQTFEQKFQCLLHERNPAERFAQSTDGHNSVCLLCSEDKPDQCHRRLVAEFIQKQRADVEVRHL
jgi:uncharacterized protein (DUF488 family)